ncbi:MAG: histidine kinase [Desulfuromonas sp.]|nr:MAG: histidine kinase [Desulfuromonas sp.]
MAASIAKILVVDDEVFIRRVLDDLLRASGYEVRFAVDGEEALQQVTDEVPDLVLLDLVMPRMNGVETCRRLRQMPHLKYTPIMMMTSRADLQGEVNPFTVGVDDYVAKPFDHEELLARIQGSLVKKRTMEALDRKAKARDALLEISESLTSSLETEEILRRIVGRIASDVEDVYRCSIALIQEDEQVGYVLASSDDPSLSNLQIDLRKYPEIEEVVRTGRHILIEDVCRDPLLAKLATPLSGEAFNTILVVPVTFRKKVIGAMVVRADRQKAGISSEEVDFCQLVANVAAPALKNARFFSSVCEESALMRDTKEQLEEELRVHAVYEQLFAHASEGLAAFNRRGEVVYVNRKALKIVDYERDEVLGRDFSGLLGIGTYRELLRQYLVERRDDRKLLLFDIPVCLSERGERLLSVSFNSRMIGQELRVVAFRDVTERRLVEQELRKTKEGLEQANERLRLMDRARAEFLNTAAHDLRIPVTVVNGYCTLLKEMGTDNLTASQVEYVEAAIESSDRLVDLIGNMLDLSRLEAGKMTMEIENGDFCQLLTELERDLQTMAEKKGHHLTFNHPPSCLVPHDAECLSRVLVNLVGNAVKFTPPGGKIDISVDVDAAAVKVAVRDNGKGIPEERIADLFEEFSQLVREDSRYGAGLGLSICKKIIDAHGGTIWAESRLGEGSCFHFTLPLQG